MKAHASLYCLALGAVFGFIAPVSAQVTLVNETFADGGRTNGVDAGDIAWYSLGATGQTGNTVVANANFTSGQAFRFTSTSGNNVAVGNFSAVTLAGVGDYIEFSVQMRFTGTLGTAGPMIGLFDSKGTYQAADGFGAANFTAVADDVGYKSTKSIPNSTSDVVIKSQNATASFSSANGTTLTTGTSGGAIAANTLYSMLFRVELLAGDQLSITSTFNGGSTVTTTTGALTKTFDEAIFSASGGAGGGGTVDFSSLLITTNVSSVPEPSTYAAFCGLVVLGLAAVSRGKRRT
ncbi:MAG: PEP-CTERM sorting domain-containing protein [Rariglobus sp.]|nr:PEP-CTERM sorting domain-containing protein [Rariglobus sp.]